MFQFPYFRSHYNQFIYKQHELFLFIQFYYTNHSQPSLLYLPTYCMKVFLYNYGDIHISHYNCFEVFKVAYEFHFPNNLYTSLYDFSLQKMMLLYS